MSANERDEQGVGGELTQDTTVGTTDLTHWYTPLGRLLASIARRVAAFLGPNTALVLTLIVGVVIAFLLSFIAARIYDAVTESDGVAGLDKPILQYAISLRSPVTDAVVTGFTDIAGTIAMPIIAVVALLVLSLHRRSWTPVILIVSAGVGSLLMTVAGKDIIDRARPALKFAVPPYELSPSFPSGHTLNAVVIVGIVTYLLVLRRNSVHARVLLITGASLFAILVGLSRVFLGHHWFTDVLAGWTLGAAWLALVITAHRMYLTTRRAGPPPEPEPADPQRRPAS